MKAILNKGAAFAAVLLLAIAALAPPPAAEAHDGDFQHLKSHFYTKKKANNRFVVQRFAVVDHSGNLVRGDRVVSAERWNVGVYRVTFGRDVAECAFNVTPLAENGAIPIRFATASTGNVWGSNSVGVGVFGKTGDFQDGGFSITMTC